MTTKLDMPELDEGIIDYDIKQSTTVNENIDEIGSVKQSILNILSRLELISDWVIERGSNSNGIWEKWNSGKLVQERDGVAAVSAVNVMRNTTVTFPIPFVGNSPKCIFTSQIRFSQGECVSLSNTLTTLTIGALRKDDIYDTRYVYRAEGTWKV